MNRASCSEVSRPEIAITAAEVAVAVDRRLATKETPKGAFPVTAARQQQQPQSPPKVEEKRQQHWPSDLVSHLGCRQQQLDSIDEVAAAAAVTAISPSEQREAAAALL